MNRVASIACIQLVTSGLEPDSSFLLEVGVSAVDRETLTIPTTFRSLVAVDFDKLAVQCPPELFTKYDGNGLLERLMAENVPSLLDVDHALAFWLDNAGCSGTLKSPLVAFGADWTAKWLRAKLPVSFERLGSDRIDVGALCRAASTKPKRSNDNASVGAACVAVELTAALGALRTVAGGVK